MDSSAGAQRYSILWSLFSVGVKLSSFALTLL